MTVSSAVLRVATSSDTVRELFSHAPEGSSTRTVCGKELEVVAVEGDDAYTWQTVLKLLLRPSSARLTWVRAGACYIILRARGDLHGGRAEHAGKNT